MDGVGLYLMALVVPFVLSGIVLGVVDRVIDCGRFRRNPAASVPTSKEVSP